MVVLSLFIAGYSLMVSSMNLPFGFENDYEDGTNRSLSQKIAENQDVVQPFIMFELLFFSLFGFQKPEDFMISSLIQSWTLYAFKLVFLSGSTGTMCTHPLSNLNWIFNIGIYNPFYII